jgi:PAS domain S-box-containing protein
MMNRKAKIAEPLKDQADNPNTLRRKAEKKLKETKEGSTDGEGRAPEKIIYELEVHQIELEMQNEALQETHLALEESRNKYIDLYDFAPVGYLTLSKNAIIEEGNLTCAALLGVNRQNLINDRFRRFVAKEDLKNWDRHFISVLRSADKQTSDLQLIKKDGSRFYARVESMRIDREKKDPVIRIAISDVTDNKRAEEQLRYDALILGEVDDAIITTKNDDCFTITNWNPGAEKVYGWKKEEVLGRGRVILDNEYPGRDRKEVLLKILKTGVYEGEVVQSRKDGTRIVIDSRLIARRDKIGKITDWIAINRDITNRKKAEEVINRLSQERKLLIENMPAMIWYKDTRNNYIRVNPAGARTFGAPAEAIEGKSAFDLFPEDAENYYRDDLEVIRSGVPKFGIIQPMKTANGINLWIRTDKIPIKDEQGVITGLLVFAVDITEIKQAEDELIKSSIRVQETNAELTAAGDKLRENEMKLIAAGNELRRNEARLTESLAEKEILLSEVHHRVKNNLTAFISLLGLDGSHEDTEWGRALRKDLQNRARSMALIHETLYQTGKFSKVDMDIYLTTLVGQVADSYGGSAAIRPEVSARGVILDLARAGAAGLIINELVTNSFKYAFPPDFDCMAVRKEPCTIRVSLACDSGRYVLTVADNGRGLPPELDVPAAKSLGLKLVNFLARHQLRAEIEVRTDKGTQFIFHLKNKDEYS